MTMTTNVSSAVCALVSGALLDYNKPFKPILCCSLALCTLSGGLYMAAEVVNDKLLEGSGIWFVAIGRVIMGISTGLVSPNAMVYIARYTYQEDRTKVITIFAVTGKLCTFFGPGLSAIFVALPEVTSQGVTVLNQYSYVGLFSLVLSAAWTILACVLFSEPPKLEGGDEAMQLHVPVLKHMQQTGCWVNLVTTFVVRLNFTVFLYYVPVFAKEDLGWGQSSVSYSFLAVGGITFVYLIVYGKCCLPNFADRTICISHYSVILFSIAGFIMLSRCGDTAEPVNRWAFVGLYALHDLAFLGQGAANNSLFQKLCGLRGLGKLQALFNANNIIGQALGSEILGVFLDGGKACSMLTLCLGLSAVQIVVFGANWRSLDPTVSQQNHEKVLEGAEEAFIAGEDADRQRTP